MRFARVQGTAVPVEPGETSLIRVTVHLDEGSRLTTVRDDLVQPPWPIRSRADAQLVADQYTQETIGVDLAVEGWEVIAAGELPDLEEHELPRSATYTVRRPG